MIRHYDVIAAQLPRLAEVDDPDEGLLALDETGTILVFRDQKWQVW